MIQSNYLYFNISQSKIVVVFKLFSYSFIFYTKGLYQIPHSYGFLSKFSLCPLVHGDFAIQNGTLQAIIIDAL